MGLTREWRPWLVATGLVVCGIVSAYAYPMLSALLGGHAGRVLGRMQGDGWGLPLARSFLFAFAASGFCVSGAFIAAVAARRCRAATQRVFSIVMLPLLMGSIGAAFCLKLNLIDLPWLGRSIATRQPLPTWGLLLGAQAWQILLPFSYVFWLRLQTLPEPLVRFANVARLSPGERLRDLYWPHCRNIAAVLTFLAVPMSFYEYSKTTLLLRASPGSGTELISHWLLRLYRFYAGVSPARAEQASLAMSALAGFVALCLCLVTPTICVRALDGLSRLIAMPKLPTVKSPRCSDAAALVLIAASLVPLAGTVSRLRWGSFVDVGGFIRGVGYSLVGAALCVAIVVFLGVCLRIGLERVLERFDRRSARVFAIAIAVQAVPPIGIALCGYYWLARWVNLAGSPYLVPVLWAASQVVLAFPFAAAFVIATHLAISTRELEFQRWSRVGFLDIFRTSFLTRFSATYGLTGVFTFCLIWTEATVNATLTSLSRYIPSVAVELTHRVDGRGTSYAEAANLLAMTWIPALIALALWSTMLTGKAAPGPASAADDKLT